MDTVVSVVTEISTFGIDGEAASSMNNAIRNIPPTIIRQDNIKRGDEGLNTNGGLSKKNYLVDYTPFMTEQNRPRVLILNRESETITNIRAFGPNKAEADLNLIILQDDGGIESLKVQQMSYEEEEVVEKLKDLELSEENNAQSLSCNEDDNSSDCEVMKDGGQWPWNWNSPDTDVGGSPQSPAQLRLSEYLNNVDDGEELAPYEDYCSEN